MASKSLQAQRFVKIINQQLDVLKEERNTVTDAVDKCINQVQIEVDAWVNGGLVNQTTCAKMSNRIQQVITLFIEKSVELSGQIAADECDLNQSFLTNANSLTSPGANSKVKQSKTETLVGSFETVPKLAITTSDKKKANDIDVTLGSDATHKMTMKFAVLEEAVYSLKKTTETLQDKIENVDKILKDVSTKQVYDHKKVDILTNTKLKSEKKIKDKITELEKRYQEIKSTADNMFVSKTNVDEKLNRLKDENNSLKFSMNELNKEISSVRTCSNDALMSIQDLSKSVECTNQHYNEMSNKMNQLEISINLMSSQYTEQLENMSNRKTDKAADLKDYIVKRVAEMSKKIMESERKCTLPKVGFLAVKYQYRKARLCTIKSYDRVDANYGGHFNQTTGVFTVPLNGLYLMSVMTLDPHNTNTNTIGCYEKYKHIPLHGVSINQQ